MVVVDSVLKLPHQDVVRHFKFGFKKCVGLLREERHVMVGTCAQSKRGMQVRRKERMADLVRKLGVCVDPGGRGCGPTSLVGLVKSGTS